MEKERLIKEIEELYTRLENEPTSKGETELIISKIQINQSKIHSIELIENNKKNQIIIENNKMTSRYTIILSILTIILSITSLYHAFTSKEVNYSFELGKLSKQQQMVIEYMDKIEKKIETKIQPDSTTIR
ncbi:MAG: hypothetical protein KDD45_15805 [Bdellovibrionales bacterium]|nr:hypothetical protein [Bdellovibrionales bacterium]